MNFAIPRNNVSEMLLYLWKVIDLPYISYSDLLYKIAFELFLIPPDKAKNFINESINDNFLIKDENQILKLSKALNKQLQNWQKERKNAIIKKINSHLKIENLKYDIEKKEPSKFSTLINAFVDKGTLNRSVTITDAAFELLEFDRSKGLIKSTVVGTKEEFYIIEIDIKNHILRHNCHDFETRRAENKKFCKHITKLFLLLKEKNDDTAIFFLNELAEKIDKWDFII